MATLFRKIGNSAGLTVPQALARELGFEIGSKLELVAENGGLMVRHANPHPRAGWAEDAALIGADPLTDDERDWLDMPNEADKDLVW